MLEVRKNLPTLSQWQRYDGLIPRPHPKIGERGLVSLAKVCAVSVVFVWSRGITFVHNILLPITTFFRALASDERNESTT